ncbi:membrane-associated progesterone receptor component 1-like [Actinia tenebrosa]|uniref:Membrane-associated progesterone receptor component 1-like n=1 Tax=Actinia tenebrosa TaxID=6105 RepID=A0A6P8IA94_ACTTE|nr:membrane-associated progesterone receptor component 1-like [Actinia tenebrosa]
MGKCVNLSVPLLAKWRTIFESRDIFDVLGFLIQIPLQALFLLGTICLTLQITWRKIRPLPKEKPQKSNDREERKVEPCEFTLQELKMYDGIRRHEIYVAINRKVFDVSSAWEYFGPEGPDSSLAGRDASRALVTLSQANDCSKIDDFSDFNALQLDCLFEVETQYLERYNYVGDLVEKKQPNQLQNKCIDIIRGAMKRSKKISCLKVEDVHRLPLPRLIQHQILDVYKTDKGHLC